MLALGVMLEGRMICISCAEQIANEGGYPHLFWMTQRVQTADTLDVCPRCGHAFGDAEESAGRVAELMMESDPDFPKDKTGVSL